MGSFCIFPSSSKSTESWEVIVPCSLLKALPPLRDSSAARSSSASLIRYLLCSAVSRSMNSWALADLFAFTIGSIFDEIAPSQAVKRVSSWLIGSLACSNSESAFIAALLRESVVT